jgi:hypothetical protein
MRYKLFFFQKAARTFSHCTNKAYKSENTGLCFKIRFREDILSIIILIDSYSAATEVDRNEKKRKRG